jgi:hypothetical protein
VRYQAGTDRGRDARNRQPEDLLGFADDPNLNCPRDSRRPSRRPSASANREEKRRWRSSISQSFSIRTTSLTAGPVTVKSSRSAAPTLPYSTSPIFGRMVFSSGSRAGSVSMLSGPPVFLISRVNFGRGVGSCRGGRFELGPPIIPLAAPARPSPTTPSTGRVLFRGRPSIITRPPSRVGCFRTIPAIGSGAGWSTSLMGACS